MIHLYISYLCLHLPVAKPNPHQLKTSEQSDVASADYSTLDVDPLSRITWGPLLVSRHYRAQTGREQIRAVSKMSLGVGDGVEYVKD